MECKCYQNKSKHNIQWNAVSNIRWKWQIAIKLYHNFRKTFSICRKLEWKHSYCPVLLDVPPSSVCPHRQTDRSEPENEPGRVLSASLHWIAALFKAALCLPPHCMGTRGELDVSPPPLHEARRLCRKNTSSGKRTAKPLLLLTSGITAGKNVFHAECC